MKLNWDFKLGDEIYDGAVTQMLSAINKNTGETIDLGVNLNATDRSVNLPDTVDENTEITLKAKYNSESSIVSQTLYAVAPSTNIANYKWAPYTNNGAIAWGCYAEITDVNDLSNVTKNSYVLFNPKIIYRILYATSQAIPTSLDDILDINKIASTRDFKTTFSYQSPYSCYYKVGDDGTETEWKLNSPIRFLVSESTNVTFRVKFYLYNLKSEYPTITVNDNNEIYELGTKDIDYTEYEITKTVNITVGDEGDTYDVDITNAKSYYRTKDECIESWQTALDAAIKQYCTYYINPDTNKKYTEAEAKEFLTSSACWYIGPKPDEGDVNYPNKMYVTYSMKYNGTSVTPTKIIATNQLGTMFSSEGTSPRITIDSETQITIGANGNWITSDHLYSTDTYTIYFYYNNFIVTKVITVEKDKLSKVE